MTQIFVGNLSYETSEPDLRSTFERYGRVAAVRLATDFGTGRPRGFAFVTMPRMEDAEEAIVNLNGARIAGRAIVVNEAQNKDRSAQIANRQQAISLLNLM